MIFIFLKGERGMALASTLSVPPGACSLSAANATTAGIFENPSLYRRLLKAREYTFPRELRWMRARHKEEDVPRGRPTLGGGIPASHGGGLDADSIGILKNIPRYLQTTH